MHLYICIFIHNELQRQLAGQRTEQAEWIWRASSSLRSDAQMHAMLVTCYS